MKRIPPLGIIVLCSLPLAAARGEELPGESIDPATAILNPDKHAWALFTELNRDAGTGDGRVVWETWKNAVNPDEIFKPDGTKPEPWGEGAKPRSNKDFESRPKQLEMARAAGGKATIQFDPDAGTGNEVRMNRPAFNFIVDNGLYNKEGQLAFFSRQNADRPGPGFPMAAKEIKAQWRPLGEGKDPSRYHTAKHPDTGELWGLTSLHITTKDLPNWFWATFEHRDNEGIEDQVPSVDSHGLPAPLKGTKWENYVLRGTQIDFVSPVGTPTILASSQIEEPFQKTSSCITCHARATIGKLPESNEFLVLDIFESFSPLRGSVGAPDPRWFFDPNAPAKRLYHQLDFVWSLDRASSVNR
ncbi:hypothetical protein [Luteolibacter luteus]|uniref:Uncharacterized protein n=1 Tax=Luteolibacter luteus TaxID=2728835 RepID=A0A858RPH5_9BACT|nr:hypothetical protein [Luteolibacter luteus]QJE98917.1 hypothetical protein HHL09_25105 [Luteolibacter luteus]